MFKIYGDRAELWQWDLNQKIIVENDTISEVHFCDGIGNCSLVCEVYELDGLRVANIPNIILQDNCNINIYTYHNINVFAFVKDQDGSYTKHKETIKVNKRSKPADYVYTETEVKSYEMLMEKLDEIEQGLIDKIDSEYEVKLQEKIEVFDEVTNNHAAEKIEVINEAIDNYAAEKIEEYNNNADNLISIVADTRNELERVKNDVLETGEASGNYLQLEDSTMAELQELEVNSNEVQKQEPTPDNPQEIPMITTDSVLKSVGKNLFDYIGSILTSYYGTTSTKENNGFKGGHGYYVSINKLFKKGTYTISFKVKDSDGSDYGNFTLFDNSNNTVINFAFNQTSSTNKKTITIDEDVFISKIRIDNRKQLTTQLLYDLQIEKEDKATEYEPYQESILNMPIPEGEFVGYINDNAKDRFRVGYNEEDGNYHLYLDKMLGKVVLDGSEEWLKSEKGYLIKANTPTFVKRKLCTPGLCNNFIVEASTVYTWTGLYKCGWNEAGAFWIQDNYNLGSTLEEWKNWLNTHNPMVYYQLANPYTLDLGIVDMPLSYDGVTNIFVDSDFLMNINTKYYRNFTETVRNLQINNDTLKNELVNINNRLSSLEAAQASIVSESEVIE